MSISMVACDILQVAEDTPGSASTLDYLDWVLREHERAAIEGALRELVGLGCMEMSGRVYRSTDAGKEALRCWPAEVGVSRLLRCDRARRERIQQVVQALHRMAGEGLHAEEVTATRLGREMGVHHATAKKWAREAREGGELVLRTVAGRLIYALTEEELPPHPLVMALRDGPLTRYELAKRLRRTPRTVRQMLTARDDVVCMGTLSRPGRGGRIKLWGLRDVADDMAAK